MLHYFKNETQIIFCFQQKNKKLDLLRSGVGMADDDDSSDPFAPSSSKGATRKAKPSESSTVVPTTNTPRPQAPKPPRPRALETTDVFKKPSGMGSSRKTVVPKTTVLPTPKATQTPVKEIPETKVEGTPEETPAVDRPEGETNSSVLFRCPAIVTSSFLNVHIPILVKILHFFCMK